MPTEVIRFKCKCGRVYAKKTDAVNHEKICKCWKNPDHKTCLTCKHKNIEYDSNGMEHEPQFLETWQTNLCSHHCKERIPHKKAPTLNINCPFWVYYKNFDK